MPKVRWHVGPHACSSSLRSRTDAMLRLRARLTCLGKDVLVPLTPSLYVPGKLKNVGSVLVDVGTGYFIEKVRFELIVRICGLAAMHATRCVAVQPQNAHTDSPQPRPRRSTMPRSLRCARTSTSCSRSSSASRTTSARSSTCCSTASRNASASATPRPLRSAGSPLYPCRDTLSRSLQRAPSCHATTRPHV